MAEEEAVPPERPTQRLISCAADPHPLNRLPVGLQSEDELDDDLLLAQVQILWVRKDIKSGIEVPKSTVTFSRYWQLQSVVF